MESVKSRTLEITVLSAQNLCVNRTPVTENVYVVVRTESINSFTTSMGTEGGSGSYPSWNEKFLVNMPMHARSITFEVKCKTATGVKNVGVARIAVSDFLGRSFPESCSQVLSYRLRDWEGRRNGIIHFSVRVTEMPECSTSNVKPANVMAVKTTEKVSACGFQMRASMGEMNSNGVTMAVPVWWNNYTGSNV